jgi:hypothetical protein
MWDREYETQKKVAIVNICKQCGSEFVSKKHHTHRQSYCSRECFYRLQDRRKIVICQFCGKSFRVKNAPSRTERGKYCSVKCWHEVKRKELLSGRSRWPGNVRSVLLGERGKRCELCGYNRVPDIVILHHIDGAGTANHPDNLIFLCPTCHAEEHYKLNQHARIFTSGKFKSPISVTGAIQPSEKGL